MPGGFSQSLGLLAFPAIKAAGYTAFAFYLNNQFPERPRNVFLVGICRMLLGLMFGTILAFFSFPFVFVFGVGVLIYLLGLIPVRVLEWWIIIKMFYGDPEQKITWNDTKGIITSGVICSFVLDIPALIGFVYAADFWIC